VMGVLQRGMMSHVTATLRVLYDAELRVVEEVWVRKGCK